jgi:alkane 1-monooxygenase
MLTQLNKWWHEWKYLLGYLVPLSAFMSLYMDEWWTFTTFYIGFGVIPILELFFTGTPANYTKEEEEKRKNNRLFDLLLYLHVPLQYALLVLFLYRVATVEYSIVELIGITVSFGMCCGVIGINVAHELGHRRNPYEIIMAKMLLATTLYMHFYIEHNRGHHKYVSTPLDPASARKGEMLYLFWFRSIIGSYINAWKHENTRLKKEGKTWLHYENEMLRFQVIQAALVAAVYFIFGLKATILFLAAAFIGYLLLESVNYIEHYGLRRREIKPGVYEKCLPMHSWNSNHDLGRIMLYELTRHSDHHYLASRKYQILRHFDQSPQLPTGYPGAIILAAIPPLWFKIMDKRINAFNATIREQKVSA